MSIRRDEANLILTINGTQATGTLRDLQKQSRDLRRLLERLPVDSDEFKKVQAELAAVNAKIKDVNDGIRGITKETGAWGLAMSVAGGVLAALNLQNILDSAQQWISSLFNIGTGLDTMQAKVRTVFGDAETIVRGFAETNARDLGLAREQYVNLATSAGDLLKPMGFTEDAVAKLSVQLTDQAGILAEWSQGRVSTEQSSEILTKALLGERDALNSLGIDIKDSIIQAELKKKGLDDLTGASRRQAEALITLEQITLQSASANEAFDKNGQSQIRTLAQLRARLAEVTQSVASALVPVFNLAIQAGVKLIDWAIRFAQTLAAIPGFVSENRVAILALITALVSLNAQGILAAANSLRMAAAQQAATIATTAQAAAQRVLNFVMAANPIGLVVAALAALAGALVTAYQHSETFRRVVTGVFSAVTESVKNTLGFFKDLGAGLFNLFTGDFEGALSSFGNAFNRLNPAQIGKSLKESFVEGYQSVPTPPAEIKGNTVGAKNEGAKVGKAMADGFESQFAALRASGERGAGEMAKAAKSALDARLKEIEVGFLKEELVADRALVQREIKEGEHARRVLLLKRQQYELQLEAFRRFNQDSTRAALEAQKNLLEVNYTLGSQGGVAPLPAIATLPPQQVAQQTPGPAPAVAIAELQATDAELDALRDKFVRIADAENEFALLRAEQERNRVDARLQYLRDNGLIETEIFRATLAEKNKADEAYQTARLENEQRTEDLRRALTEKGYEAQKGVFDGAITLLSLDEKARKKHSGAIKAIQVAQVQIDSIREIQGIWASVSNVPFPFNTILGAALTAGSVARAIGAVVKIENTKFAGGGPTGPGYGMPDSTGFKPAGIVHEDEWVGPKWMVNSPQYGPTIHYLESVRKRGFAEGGYSTTPTPSVTGIVLPGVNQEMLQAFDKMSSEMRGMRNDIANWRDRLRADVVYTDVEEAGTELAGVRDDAGI